MSLNKLNTLVFIGIMFCISGCDNIIPNTFVWLRKIDFEVDPQANRGNSFVCHVTVAYTQDLQNKLNGFANSKIYFENVENLKKTYKDSIEIFQFDMIPGKNQLDKKINLRSYTKAKGAFVFAKYTTPGKYIENVGLARTLTVRFLSNKMELHSDISLDKLVSELR